PLATWRVNDPGLFDESRVWREGSKSLHPPGGSSRLGTPRPGAERGLPVGPAPVSSIKPNKARGVSARAVSSSSNPRQRVEDYGVYLVRLCGFTKATPAGRTRFSHRGPS